MNKLNKNYISIVIPIYKEHKNIELLTNKLIYNLRNFTYEIIFVDDNSLDGSHKILNDLKKKYKFFRPIIRRKKRDLTQSCFEGINKSRFNDIIIMDGDLQHDPKYIRKMYNKLKKKNYDIVVGSRNFKSNNLGLSKLRKISSQIIIKLFSIFKFPISDPMSGFFIFKKKIYIKNKSFYFGKGFKILMDIMLNSKDKLNVSEIKIKFKHRRNNESKMNYKILIYLLLLYLTKLKKIF